MLLVDELTQRGCRGEFVERPMSDDPHDQLLLQIRSAVAEYERTLIAERMRRGRQAKLRDGQLLPWTRAPYGYLLDPERPRDPSRVRIDPVQAAIVAQMFAWYTDPQQTVSLYEVAKRLSEAQIPTPKGGKRWNVASVRGILRSPTYTGVAYSGRSQSVRARQRKSALQPVGSGQSQQPAPMEAWIAIPVPALISQETFEAAQHRLERNVQMARRNNTAHEYLLRGLVSCAQCRLTCAGRTLTPGYHYYVCQGRADALRAARGDRCTARYAPAHALDELVWQDLCRVLREPALITHELARAQMGEWLPQALQARRQTLRDVLAQLERQQARLLDLYLAEVIERAEFARKRKEVTQTQHGLTQQLRQLDAQAQQHVNVAALAQGIEALCQRLLPTLDTLTFAQRRQLVELLIDRVIVNDAQVEIRYVVPTGPKGETTPFCHLRLDYLYRPPIAIGYGQQLRVQVQPIRDQDHDVWRPILPRLARRDLHHAERLRQHARMVGRAQAAQDRIADDTRVHGGGREGALLLHLVGGVVLHPAEEAARQVVQVLKQAIVDIAPVDDIEAARLHQAPPLGPLRPVAGRDRDIDGPLAQDRKRHMPLGGPMLVVLPHGPGHARQGGQEAAVDGG
jgi:site-specific DNA recombinase